MSAGTMRFWRDLSIQNKMLVIILPLVVIPMLILAAVGFTTSSREAAKTSSRYLTQRETDLRTLAENPALPNYFNNRAYGLAEEAEVARRELERSLKRFADRNNSIELIYPQVRYVDHRGDEIAKVIEGQVRSDRGRVMAEPFFTEYRRDLVARTFFDLLKIAVGAAFASKFFVEFAWGAKVTLWGVIAALGLGGFFVSPRRPPKKE